MEYIKPGSTVLIGNTGKSKSPIHPECTETLGFFTQNAKGDEEVVAIAFSLEQLVELKNTIDTYLKRIGQSEIPETAVANNFINIKPHPGISESEVIKVFDQVSKQVAQQLFGQK